MKRSTKIGIGIAAYVASLFIAENVGITSKVRYATEEVKSQYSQTKQKAKESLYLLVNDNVEEASNNLFQTLDHFKASLPPESIDKIFFELDKYRSQEKKESDALLLVSSNPDLKSKIVDEYVQDIGKNGPTLIMDIYEQLDEREKIIFLEYGIAELVNSDSFLFEKYDQLSEESKNALLNRLHKELFDELKEEGKQYFIKMLRELMQE
ncbi:hypothetical protein ACFLZX_04835 [Nanoarchaeota archaeon]